MKLIATVGFNLSGSQQTLYAGDPGEADLEFSPDGAYFPAFPRSGAGKELGYDMRTETVLEVPRTARKQQFCRRLFVSKSRLLLVDPLYPLKHGLVNTKIVEFPSKVIAR